LIPLSIAFMRADGTITDIDEMQAETENNHCPRNNGVYALEMSKGWFASKGIQPGMQIKGFLHRNNVCPGGRLNQARLVCHFAEPSRRHSCQ